MSRANHETTTAGAQSAVASSTRRRSLMAGLAALAAGAACAAVTAAPAAGDDAELIRLADEIMTLHAETNRLSDIEDTLPDWPARNRFAEKNIRPLVDRHHELMPELERFLSRRLFPLSIRNGLLASWYTTGRKSWPRCRWPSARLRLHGRRRNGRGASISMTMTRTMPR